MFRISSTIKSFFEGRSESSRPLLDKNRQSSIPGLYVIGDLAGAPVIKLAMTQGVEVIEHIASSSNAKSKEEDVIDIIIGGAGAAGLNAALEARDRGMSVLVLEKYKIANTIENFPDGKWVYAEPDELPPRGKLWLDGARKEDLITRWHSIIKDNSLKVKTEEGIESIEKQAGIFHVKTSKSVYKARRVILATGQRGNPATLNVPGEDLPFVGHTLYNPNGYWNEDIVIIGGGNSAAEAAISLSEKNRVSLLHRGPDFHRVFPDNLEQLRRLESEKKIRIYYNTQVKRFSKNKVQTDSENLKEISCARAFVLIGSKMPRGFLKSLNIRLENEWSGNFFRSFFLALSALAGLYLLGINKTLAGAALSALSFGGLLYSGLRRDRFAWLAISFLASYTIYGVKPGPGMEFWPFHGWGYSFLSFGGRSWSFWYTVLYTVFMTLFGFGALKRWGLDKRDRFQIWRYISLLGFQWFFFFILPEFLFQWALQFEWIRDLGPQFTDQPWRTYGIIYAWPLFFYTFFYDPHTIWIVWGILLSFVILPLFSIWHGKRYCSWICGCGGLAETLGDRWRHLAPKGENSIRWEWMGTAVLVLASVATLSFLIKDIVYWPSVWTVGVYRILIDIWLVGIIPISLYPFFGGKIWCRYWCPLAKMMQLTSKLSAIAGLGRFGIQANSKCIACSECSRYCQVGIDVMKFALKQEILNNTNSSCIGCGICVSACPMDVLSFQSSRKKNPGRQLP